MTPTFGIEWRAALSIAIRCAADAVRAARSFVVLLPLVPWMVARGGVAYWLSGFPAPPRDRLADVWELAGGWDATYFPMSVATVPRVAWWFDPLLEFAIGVAGLAVVCALLPAIFRGERPDVGRAWRRATGRLGPAWIAAAPGVLGGGVLMILADALNNLPAFRTEIYLVVATLGVLWRALFVYAVAAVVIGNVSPWNAWRRSASLLGTYLGPTIALVAVSVVATWPWHAAPWRIVDELGRVMPQWVGTWTVFGAIPIVLAGLFVTAATTRLYLHGYGAEEA